MHRPLDQAPLPPAVARSQKREQAELFEKTMEYGQASGARCGWNVDATFAGSRLICLFRVKSGIARVATECAVYFEWGSDFES